MMLLIPTTWLRQFGDKSEAVLPMRAHHYFADSTLRLRNSQRNCTAVATRKKCHISTFES